MSFLFKKKLHIAICLSALAIVIAAFAISRETHVGISVKEISSTASSTDPFSGISLEAKAAYVLDLSTGKILFAKNADEVLPLASLTKLVSVIVATNFLPAKTLVPITPFDLASEGDTGLLSGEKWDLDTLTRFTLVTSSNDGITAIASVAGATLASPEDPDPIQAFVDAMNHSMTSFGFSDMYFFNPTGLDQSATTSGGYGSAKDVAGIISRLLKTHPELIEVTGAGKMTFDSNEATHVAQNTDEALPYIPSVVASKTGYTDLAGGNLAVILDAGLMHPVVLVVLGSSYDGRFSDMRALVSAATKDLAQK